MLQRFSVVVTLVLAAVVASNLSDGPARLPLVAIPIPPAIEPVIVRAVCHECKVRVTPVPAFARALPAKTDINRACIRDWNDTLRTRPLSIGRALTLIPPDRPAAKPPGHALGQGSLGGDREGDIDGLISDPRSVCSA